MCLCVVYSVSSVPSPIVSITGSSSITTSKSKQGSTMIFNSNIQLSSCLTANNKLVSIQWSITPNLQSSSVIYTNRNLVVNTNLFMDGTTYTIGLTVTQLSIGM